MLDATAISWNDDGTVQVGEVAFGVLGEGVPEDLLLLYKSRDMIDAYSPIIDEFRGGRMVELGIFRGGSTGFFAVAMAPARLVAFELSSNRIGLLDHLVEANGLTDAIRLHYGVDQSDRETVSTIVDRELDGDPLDLVIDDASHIYGPTVASFEVLFPRLRPGGLYVVEDWLPPTALIEHFAAVAAQPRSEAVSAVEASLADQLRDPTSRGSHYFIDWFVRAALDGASPHHEAVRRWYDAILADDQPAGQVLRECLQPVIECGWTGVSRHPCLATMATELVVALANDTLSGIADVRITPMWIEIRRSDQPLVPGEFRYDEVVYDHFGAMGGSDADDHL